MQERIQQHLLRQLSSLDDDGARPNRLVEESRRLWGRVRRLMGMKLVEGAGQTVDAEVMEVACYALHLPGRQRKSAAVSRLGQVNLRERAEQSAELLADSPGPADAELIDRVETLLRQVPQRMPASNEARLLADALNLDDFGVTGLVAQVMLMSRNSASVGQVVEGFNARQRYGYWEARLKDGFHFEKVRAIARRRLESAIKVVEMLAGELKEDAADGQ